MLVAALAVIAPVMLGALLSGRRPGTLGPASGILVGATALQVAVLVALADPPPVARPLTRRGGHA
ncbi:hypothetical protein GY12_18010 [Micrococcus luteus]|nr:hypothetical protein GY12_18010 [Micrococcus luteus]